jgi:hypothetical protein
MDSIGKIRAKIFGEVFDYQVLMDALTGYRKPRDKITRLLAAGAIVRIKKGLYCFGKLFHKAPISRQYLANLIYGPSYISVEYGCFHGSSWISFPRIQVKFHLAAKWPGQYFIIEMQPLYHFFLPQHF